MMQTLLVIIAIMLYINVGYTNSAAYSTGKSGIAWYVPWLLIIIWPIHLLWSMIGMCFVFGKWAHGKLFPKS